MLAYLLYAGLKICHQLLSSQSTSQHQQKAGALTHSVRICYI